MLQTPDGNGRLELFEYIHPDAIEAEPTRPNEINMHRVAFSVDDLDQALEIAAKHGCHPLRGVATYGDVYKLTYVRDPSGILVMLAEEELHKKQVRSNDRATMDVRNGIRSPATCASRLHVHEAEGLASPYDREQQEPHPCERSQHRTPPDCGVDEDAERHQGKQQDEDEIHSGTVVGLTTGMASAGSLVVSVHDRHSWTRTVGQPLLLGR